MKKRICLLLTLIVSMVVGVKSVVAAKKMYCIYEGTWAEVPTMLVQDSSGGISMFYHKNTGTFSADDEGWYEYTYYDITFDSEYYDKEKKELSSCPDYFSTYQTKNKVVFHDKKITGQENRDLIDYSTNDEDIDINAPMTFENASIYQEQIKNTKWLGKCIYGLSENSKLELYFNNDTYIVASYFSNFTTARFTLNQLLDVVNDARACPPYIYMYSSTTDYMDTDDIYLFYDEIKDKISGVIGGVTFTKTEIPIVESDVDIDFGSSVVPEEPIDDCNDLFGDELVEQINKIMDIVKIAVPILLIAFGIIDFTKAIFAGSEDNMKKAQKTFFNRIIAAILVFIAPIFINLILSLANEVWGYISPETCIEQSE